MAYDYLKTLKKIAYSALVVIIAGLASVYANNPYILAVIPVLEGVKNAYKHWND